MTDFKTHTIDSAPEGSKAILQGAQDKLQFVPNLFATMAEAPALLEGYTTLAGIFDKTSFSETERQIVMITNNLLNGCTYCMSAHTALAKMGGVPDDVIEALRANTPIADAKLEALRQFAIVINETRGWPDHGDLEAFFNAGYKQQHVLEIVLGTALKVLSNYTNHIAETDLDDAFKAVEWQKSDLKEAA